MQNFAVIREKAGVARLQPAPIPKLEDDYLLVKPVTIALNPTDWTTLDAPGDAGTIVGCDYAGIVEEVGKDLVGKFKKGDRVAGFAHGGNDAKPQTGAFARYLTVKGETQTRIPEGVSFETAATIGVGTQTAGFALYHVLKYPLPDAPQKSDETILIYGGSTATGTLAIQFAKLSGLKVITTCSPKHFDLMKKLGADAIYDYRTPDVGKKIRADTNGSLKNVFDTVSVDSSAAICGDALGPNGGFYLNLLGVNCPRSDVTSTWFLVYSITGEYYIFEGEEHEAKPEDFVFGENFARVIEKLWEQGLFTPHPQRVNGGGILGALEGLQQLREGKVSGEKLVYRVDETNWDEISS